MIIKFRTTFEVYRGFRSAGTVAFSRWYRCCHQPKSEVYLYSDQRVHKCSGFESEFGVEERGRKPSIRPSAAALVRITDAVALSCTLYRYPRMQRALRDMVTLQCGQHRLMNAGTPSQENKCIWHMRSPIAAPAAAPSRLGNVQKLCYQTKQFSTHRRVSF